MGEERVLGDAQAARIRLSSYTISRHPYTLYGSLRSDVSVILKVTLALGVAAEAGAADMCV